MDKLFQRKKNPEHLAKQLKEALENPNTPVKPDKSGKVVDIVTKRLNQIKLMLYGDGEHETNPQKCAQMSSLLIADNMIPRLVLNLEKLPFEARKHVAQIYNNLMRRDVCGFVEYVDRQPQIMSALVHGYENAEIALNCGTMLRESIRHEILARQILYSPDLWKFFDTYVHLPNFDVGSDAFATFKDLLTRHKPLVSAFFDSHFNQVFEKYNKLLSSENYVTRRQSLKLLGEILLDRSNFDIMMQYICKRENLKMMMNLLRDPSVNIQFEAFHVFKVFVANPKKPNEITQILLTNKDKLIAYLEKFQNEKEDEQFVEEKNLLIRTLSTLELRKEDDEGTTNDIRFPLSKLSWTVEGKAT
ncbi:calcium-binding protein [Thraustotheca clavata]|uniref:Calcium-binding protein n=1 Tax=Thraustotheca clavata TaxID=74557 RepID=A0A1W0A6Q8_9STRA|nr:calcium-binding protein [Thraustotheca clavata]